MRARNPFLQALLLIVLASVIAVVANAFASRTRRLVLPGFYPNALRVPPRVPERVLPTPVAPAQPAPVTQTVTDVGRASARPDVTTTAPVVAPPVVTGTTATATTTSAPPVGRAEARPTLGDDLARFQPHPDKAYVEISGEDAAALYAKGVLFLDARRSAAYEEGHIAGARPFSVWEADVDDKVNALFEERQDPAEQNKPIVIYCTGGACEDSHMLAQKLWGVQFNNVYVYKDGFPDWQKRGGAVRTGATP
ncbi:MAG TPA: rhodanese-like domain-containing protein [Thermoanaerobaculia bacterium]|nr:rhodanese-like domain-containing protein [Thermoanaerobaculia bacterium]